MKKRITSLLISLTLILTSSSIFANGIDIEYVDYMAKFIKSNYLYEIEDQKLTEGALKGLFSSLDPYSEYYTEEEYKRLTEILTGELEQAGIGIKVTETEGKIMITEVMKNNPAEKSGLRVEDHLVSVDQTDISNMTMDKVVEMIRGLAGSTVEIGVSRQGTKETLYFDIVREPIIITPVEYRVLDHEIGYIKVNEFNNNALIAVKVALHQFDSQEIGKVIFDVRDNPGGYLSTVSDMLQMLIPQGPIFHTRDNKGNQTTQLSYNRGAAKYELAVLVNEKSASASEIFAAAIRERGVGKIIGMQTYGKGTVQSIMNLKDGGAIKLTVAEYFTPDMNRVNQVGIEPDIIIDDIYIEGRDQILEKAIEEIK